MTSPSILAAVAALAIAAGGGAGAIAWQKNRELQQANAELATTRATLARATRDLRAAQQQVAALEKDLAEARSTADMARAERDSVRNLLAAESEQGNRLRAEVQLLRQQIAFVRSRQAPAQFAPPMVAPQPRPMVIRAGPAGQAVGAPSPAMPAQR